MQIVSICMVPGTRCAQNDKGFGVERVTGMKAGTLPIS